MPRPCFNARLKASILDEILEVPMNRITETPGLLRDFARLDPWRRRRAMWQGHCSVAGSPARLRFC
jgi:hypothetical protein